MRGLKPQYSSGDVEEYSCATEEGLGLNFSTLSGGCTGNIAILVRLFKPEWRSKYLRITRAVHDRHSSCTLVWNVALECIPTSITRAVTDGLWSIDGGPIRDRLES